LEGKFASRAGEFCWKVTKESDAAKEYDFYPAIPTAGERSDSRESPLRIRFHTPNGGVREPLEEDVSKNTTRENARSLIAQVGAIGKR